LTLVNRNARAVCRSGLPSEYINRMMTAYKQLFNEKPKLTVTYPFEKGDHPELDIFELLLEDDVQKYQSLIGAM
jgi:hypothetical protein